MKKLMTLALAAGLAISCASEASAIDFKAKGQWLMGFNLGQGSLVRRDAGRKVDYNDKFSAGQRVRFQLDAVASEALSGTVYFEIGDTTWGRAANGGALGADGKIVEVKRAYIDWMPPETDLKVRMGLQGMTLPNAAGGSAVLDDDVAGISMSYQFNENVGIVFSWARPLNDNYKRDEDGYVDPVTKTWVATPAGSSRDSYLDNVDVFALGLPLTFDGIEATPWVAYGMIGKNAFRGNGFRNATQDNFVSWTTSNYFGNRWNKTSNGLNRRDLQYGSAFWGGLPVKLTLWDPFNIEFDFNYGYVQSVGSGTLTNSNGKNKSFTTKRAGWLVKALVEYKMDWGTPGIFGWYASGDDGNPKNGSERMPSISPCGNFTSFLGDGNWGWASDYSLYDRNMSYAGTWGIGLQVRDMSFLEDLTHTFRVALWGGTNSPKMAKYASSPVAWDSDWGKADSAPYENELYLTKMDYLLEFNLVNSYQMYENFEVNFELGYVVNMVDRDVWKKNAGGYSAFTKQDAWKAQLIFAYTF
ncbi:MAG: outer membrane homotrimeric porin [Desulfovibrio sp.]|nr:outer membrane homotrimeric porin [Desulfovibrio sp.]